MSKISVKPEKISLRNLLDKISDSKIRIPVFQRDFVWKPKQMLELFDSIIRGYPIGSLLLWKPDETYKTLEKIGPYAIIDQNPKEISYVLDGYQRLTTLFGVLTNPKNFEVSEDSIEKKYLIYYTLKDIEDEDIPFRFNRGKKDIYQILLYKILDTFEYLDYIDEIRIHIEDKNETKRLIEKCKQLNKLFFEYEIPYIEIDGGDIESAVEIFSRINSTGKAIDIDYMLSALSYNKDTNFLLSEKITVFLNSMSSYGFDTLNRDVVLNCIINSQGKFYYDVKLKELKKLNIEFIAENTFPHLQKAIEFIYKRLYVIDIKLLPYPSQVIFISEFFRLNPNANTENYEEKLKKIEKWFWLTSYTNYFTASLAFQRKAYKTFIEFAKTEYNDSKNGLEEYNPDEQLEVESAYSATLAFPKKIEFTGVRPKVLQLFMIKHICENKEIEENESIKEIFMFNKKDRTPSNMILRLSSEFEQSDNKKNIENFIKDSDIETLEKHFINEELKQLYLEGEEEFFLIIRDELIQKKEKEFVEKLGITYTMN